MNMKKPNTKRIIAADFARRLTVACDNSDNIPDHNFGRQTYIANELERRFGIRVSKETVRKWFAGEARPRPDKMRVLAELLKIDQAWLAIGSRPNTASDGHRSHAAVSNGAVSLVIGMLTLNGASCAFPESTDPRIKSIHFYAILRGRHFGVYVSLGAPGRRGITFTLPEDCQDTVLIGVVQRSPTRYDLYQLASSTALELGVRRSGHLELTGTDHDGTICVETIALNRLEDFEILG